MRYKAESMGLTIQGETPINNEPYTATLIFDNTPRLKEVHIASERGSGVYSVEHLGELLSALQDRESAMAFWNASGESETLEQFFRRHKWPVLCGCVVDLLERMGLAAIYVGPPVKISAKHK